MKAQNEPPKIKIQSYIKNYYTYIRIIYIEQET